LRRIFFILALCASGAACGPAGLEVRADDGTVIGHVTSVERDRDGRVVAAEIEGLEPADAPAVLAEEDDGLGVRT
jgi:hypothetical protein